MVRPKPKSKRVPVRLRHNIQKAGAAKQRKQRKLAKKNPEWRSRLKKDPGVPNLFPYKERILQEIEEKRRAKDEETRLKREESKGGQRAGAVDGDHLEDVILEDAPEAGRVPEAAAYTVDDDVDDDDDAMDEDDSADPMAALVMSARARAVEFERERPDRTDGGVDEQESDDVDDDADASGRWDGSAVRVGPLRRDLSRKAFDRVFKQVLDAADVILYVLDARDPEGTRSLEVERMVLAADGGRKRLLLVLNKIDLIPSAVLDRWLAYLRRYFPTLPLRAAGSAASAHTYHHPQLTPQTTSAKLLKALKSFAAGQRLQRSVSVGVVGYPNVGKSSVVNALTNRLGGGGATACPVGAEAGVTTGLRQVKLDRKLALLDSPGIVFPTATTEGAGTGASDQARLVLLNAVPPKQIDDPISAVTLLLRRLSSSPDQLRAMLDVYSLPPLMSDPRGDMTTDFLVQVARRRGRLGKGGVPNLHSAAMTVLSDWRDGRVQGWTEPPTSQPVGVETGKNGKGKGNGDGSTELGTGTVTVGGDDKTIVESWAAEFKLDGLWEGGEGG